MSNVNCNNITLSCNSGNVTIDGVTFNRFNGNVVSGELYFSLVDSADLYKFEVSTTYGQLKLNNGYIYITNVVNEIETVEKSNNLISDSPKAGKVFSLNTLRGNISIFSVEDNEVVEEDTEANQ